MVIFLGVGQSSSDIGTEKEKIDNLFFLSILSLEEGLSSVFLQIS